MLLLQYGRIPLCAEVLRTFPKQNTSDVPANMRVPLNGTKRQA